MIASLNESFEITGRPNRALKAAARAVLPDAGGPHTITRGGIRLDFNQWPAEPDSLRSAIGQGGPAHRGPDQRS